MTLQEILKAMGLSEEQIAKVMSDMKANRIFTASEEKYESIVKPAGCKRA